ncbi:hypothetical protein ACI780_19885 [Geodermatophilus sp. SYSU D00814]
MLRDETWHQDVDGLLRALRGEPALPTARRFPWWVALAIAALLLALGAGAWWLSRPADGGGDGDDDEAEAGIAACATPTGDGWTEMGLGADPRATEQVEDGSLSFTVASAHWRPEGTGWQVVLATSMEAAVPEGAYHGDWRYDSLVVAQRQFAVTCFSPDSEFVDAETVGDALVGFDVTCEPAGHVQLRIENDAARIDVTSPALGPGDC